MSQPGEVEVGGKVHCKIEAMDNGGEKNGWRVGAPSGNAAMMVGLQVLYPRRYVFLHSNHMVFVLIWEHMTFSQRVCIYIPILCITQKERIQFNAWDRQSKSEHHTRAVIRAIKSATSTCPIE